MGLNASEASEQCLMATRMGFWDDFSRPRGWTRALIYTNPVARPTIMAYQYWYGTGGGIMQ